MIKTDHKRSVLNFWRTHRTETKVDMSQLSPEMLQDFLDQSLKNQKRMDEIIGKRK